MPDNKILFSAIRLGNAGTETFMINTTRWLLRNTDFKVDFLIFTDEVTDNTRLVESLGCRVFRLPPRIPDPIGHYSALRNFFDTYGADYSAFHFCGGSLTWIAPLRYARRAGIPVRIIHAHNSMCAGIHNRLLHHFNRHLIRSRATHFLACSPQAGEFFFGSAPFQFIRNGVDTDTFRFRDEWRKKIRKEFGIDPDETVIGAVGRLIPVKNIPKIISIFEDWLKHHPQSRLLLIGDGELREWAEAKAGTLPQGRIIIAGLRTDIPQCLSALDVLIMPSIFEGLPFSLVEAQATGLPCAATTAMSNDAKMSEAFQFIAPDAPDAEWTAAIKHLLHSAPDRHNPPTGLIAAGFDLDTAMRSLLPIYTSQHGGPNR
ncbi:MAG: glycosyltransferase [Muribaculum sp.]|nr:glycosyltransferase [Muribaculum sp.]